MDHNSLTDFLQVSEHEAELQPIPCRGKSRYGRYGTAFSSAGKHLDEIYHYL